LRMSFMLQEKSVVNKQGNIKKVQKIVT